MCRMFAYVGRSPDDLIALCSALRNACANDECLPPQLAKKNGNSHKDGWGYVIRTPTDLHHYRSTNAIYHDHHQLPALAIDQEIHAIFHGRLTTGGVIGNPIFSHPYVAYTDRSVFFFAHNGGLKEEVGKAIKDKVDSEWALDRIVEVGIDAALPSLKADTKTALNILLMAIPRDKTPTKINYLNFYLGHGTKERDDYYKMYKATMFGGGRAVFSSTLRKCDATPSIESVAFDSLEAL